MDFQKTCESYTIEANPKSYLLIIIIGHTNVTFAQNGEMGHDDAVIGDIICR
jgi:hypothetical protein